MLTNAPNLSGKTTFSLYGGQVQLEFNKYGHRYTVEGKECLGVTTVLGVIDKSGPLIYWAVGLALDYVREQVKPGLVVDEVQLKEILDTAKSAHRVKKEKAADFGTLVHEWIEQYIKGQKPERPINPQMQKATDGFLMWVQKNKVEFHDSERPVYSRRYNFAGTCDFTCTINGKRYVGDIKTSNAIYDTYMMQVSAYRLAMKEENGMIDPYDGMVIIRVPKNNGEVEVKFFNNYEANAKAFVHALYLYQHLQILKNSTKGGEK